MQELYEKNAYVEGKENQKNKTHTNTRRRKTLNVANKKEKFATDFIVDSHWFHGK